MTSNRYILVADCLGFKNINQNLQGENLKQRIREWIRLTDAINVIPSLIRHKSVASDTIFVTAVDSPEGLKALLELSQKLLNDSFQKNFPLKGGIARGEVIQKGGSVYGEAVVKAYNLCDNQNWIGIACDNNRENGVPEDHLPEGNFLWVSYPVPLKRGVAKYAPAVVWDMPGLGEMITNCSAHETGLMSVGEKFEWSIIQKLENTQIFKLTVDLRRLLAPSLPGNQGIGGPPVTLIAQFVENYIVHCKTHSLEQNASWWPSFRSLK